MKCKDIRELLSTYIDDELSQADARAVEKHLSDCAACAEALTNLNQVVDIVADIPPVTMSETSAQRLEAAIEARLSPANKPMKTEEKTPWWKWFATPAFGAIAASAAVLAIAVVLTSPSLKTNVQQREMLSAPSAVEEKAAETEMGGTERMERSASITRAEINLLAEELSNQKPPAPKSDDGKTKNSDKTQADPEPDQSNRIGADEAAAIAAGKKQIKLISSTINTFEGQEAWIVAFEVRDAGNKIRRFQVAAVSLSGRLLYLAN